MAQHTESHKRGDVMKNVFGEACGGGGGGGDSSVNDPPQSSANATDETMKSSSGHQLQFSQLDGTISGDELVGAAQNQSRDD
jgi:hypothetical protein